MQQTLGRFVSTKVGAVTPWVAIESAQNNSAGIVWTPKYLTPAALEFAAIENIISASARFFNFYLFPEVEGVVVLWSRFFFREDGVGGRGLSVKFADQYRAIRLWAITLKERIVFFCSFVVVNSFFFRWIQGSI